MFQHYKNFEKNLRKFEDPFIQQENREAPRNYFKTFYNKNNALSSSYKNKGENIINLNGIWNFRYFESSEYILPKIIKTNTLDGFVDIVVPLPWQMDNHGKMHYSDIWWTFPITPPKVITNNPTGIYKRIIEIDKFDENNDYLLRFHNADSCIEIYLNNNYIGMTKGARYTSEFKLNNFLKEGVNNLTVVVYQWSDGSYLEDQDQWWFSGLYRDVELVIESKESIEGYHIKTNLIELQNYELNIDLTLKNDNSHNIKFELFDNKKVIWKKETHAFKKINVGYKFNNVKEWTAETPYLYKLIITINDKYYITEKIGFRNIKINSRRFLINNKPVMLKGVNLHSHNAKTGKTVSIKQLERDLKRIKRFNLNAIRTAHYPQMVEFYEMCNEFGIYVMDEADLENHGFELTGDWAWTSNDSKFKLSYVERGTRMVHRDKNNPSIIMWSLGNETGFGPNFISMAKEIRNIDKTRPIHYEGDFDCEIVDIHSNMYTRIELNDGEPPRRTLDDVIEGMVKSTGELHPNWKNKPHLECEFAHAMGNGPGSLKDYFDKFYSNEAFFGGFVWELYDHGIYAKDEENNIYYKYGGDFGDSPTNGTFCIDGLIHPNGKPSPGFYEYKEVAAPIKLTKEKEKIFITNMYDFNTFDNLNFKMRIIDSNGVVHYNENLDICNLLPREIRQLEIPNFGSKNSNTYYFLQIFTTEKFDTLYSKKNDLVSVKEVELDFIEDAIPIIGKYEPTIKNTFFEKIIYFNNSKFIFDIKNGHLKSIWKKGKQIILDGPKLNFWRATIDNDKDEIYSEWTNKFFVQLFSEQFISSKEAKEEDGYVFEVKTINGAVNQAWYFESVYKYKFLKNGTFNFSVFGKPNGLIKIDPKLTLLAGSGSSVSIDPNKIIPVMLPRIGIKMKISKEYENIKYFGKGPGETYQDSKEYGYHDIWDQTSDETFFSYVYPQESGNKNKVLWASIYSKNNIFKISSKSKNKRFDVSLLWFDDQDLELAKHINELKKNDFLTLNIDYKQNGLGSNSCGPYQMKKYRCEVDDFEIDLNIKI